MKCHLVENPNLLEPRHTLNFKYKNSIFSRITLCQEFVFIDEFLKLFTFAKYLTDFEFTTLLLYINKNVILS